ncbi:MAG: helicase-related protein [Planctomycetota bacterium]
MLKDKAIAKALVFTRTKHMAKRLSEQLSKNGISADSIHSNKSQNARQQALSNFDRGRVKVLVATDIVARGIDVDGITHVINYELPNEAESYVHRIGRTARAGADGVALSFCNTDELALLGGIERLTRHPLPAMEDHRFHSAGIASLAREHPKREHLHAVTEGPAREDPRAGESPGGDGNSPLCIRISHGKTKPQF